MDRFKRQQVIDACRSDFNFFAALCLPQVLTLEFPAEYVGVSEMLFEAALDNSKDDHNFAIGYPRGHAKTTWAKIVAAWLFCFTDRKYLLVACSNENKARNFIGDVARILKSPNLSRLFGSYSEGSEKETEALKIFTYRGKTRIIQAVGASGDPRGANIDFARPDIHICDDLQSRDNAKSDVESKNLLEWYSSTFYLTKAPTGLLHIFIGNTFPYKGSILSLLRNNSNYVSFIVGGILASGEALWPALHPKEKLLADFRRAISLGQAETFLSEIMNDDKSFAAIGFDYSKLAQWDMQDSIPASSGFVMIDVAGDKKDADDTAIGAFLLYDDLNKPYFRDVEADKLSPLDTIKAALKMAVRYNIRTIFVESVAYQSSLLFWFKFICKHSGIEGFRFLPMAPRRVPKNVRIMDSLRALQANQIILHPDISSQIENQISRFDPSVTNNTDDMLDLLDYSMEIPKKHPQEISLLLDLLSPISESREYEPWENTVI